MSDPKAFSTLQARAALLGVALHALRNDLETWSYVATVGPVTVELATLDEVARWLSTLPQGADEGGGHAS